MGLNEIHHEMLKALDNVWAVLLHLQCCVELCDCACGLVDRDGGSNFYKRGSKGVESGKDRPEP